MPSVKLLPSLEAIQATVNAAAKATICVNKLLLDWGQDEVPVGGAGGQKPPLDFFQRVTQVVSQRGYEILIHT